MLELFWSFFKIGAFTLGGGYAMIPLVRDEVVEKKHWIAEDEFLNMLALAQSAPGVMAVNTAIFVGYKLHGLRGMVAALLGSVLPSFLIILLIATVFLEWKDYPQVEAVFKGIRPAVVALIAAPLYKMSKPLFKTGGKWVRVAGAVLIIVATLIIWLCKVSAIYVILATIIIAIIIVKFTSRKKV